MVDINSSRRDNPLCDVNAELNEKLRPTEKGPLSRLLRRVRVMFMTEAALFYFTLHIHRFPLPKTAAGGTTYSLVYE